MRKRILSRSVGPAGKASAGASAISPRLARSTGPAGLFRTLAGALLVIGLPGKALGQAPALVPEEPTVAGISNAPSSDTTSAYKTMSLEQLMNLDVTSVARQPEPYSEAPAALSVITSEDIRRSGASSIPEALRLADGLEVAQKSSHDWGITARGFNTDLANKLLVLVDGRSVYTPLYSGVFWDVQDYLLEDIDRIEVINGPGGTLWGANAVNGVINITSKNAKDTQGLYVEGGGGTFLQDFVGLRYGGALSSNVFFRVYGKYFDRGDEVYPDGRSASDSWRSGRGGFRLDAGTSSQDAFTLQGDIYSDEENADTGGEAHTSGGNLLGRWTHVLSDESDIQIQAYYDRTHLTDPVPALNLGAIPLAPAGTLKDDLDTYDLDFQHRFRLGERNRLVWGLGYRFTHDVVEDAPALGFLPQTLDHNLFSVFAQDEIMVVKDLFFTIGSKMEHNDYTGFEFEPSARLQWNVLKDQMIWAAVSRAVRTPSRIDRDLSEPAPPGLVLLRGDSGFDSESLIAYELGYRARLGSRVFSSISGFYNDYDNIRSTSFTPTTVLPFYFANNLEGQTYGFELSARYEPFDWLRFRAGYDLIKEHLHVKPGQMDLNNALNETSDPQQQVSLRASVDLPAHFEVDSGLRWVDTLYNNNGPTVGTVPSYFELDVRIAWHPSAHLEISLVGQNLLHDQHPEYGFPSPAREEISRSVYGKVAWKW